MNEETGLERDASALAIIAALQAANWPFATRLLDPDSDPWPRLARLRWFLAGDREACPLHVLVPGRWVERDQQTFEERLGGDVLVFNPTDAITGAGSDKLTCLRRSNGIGIRLLGHGSAVGVTGAVPPQAWREAFGFPEEVFQGVGGGQLRLLLANGVSLHAACAMTCRLHRPGVCADVYTKHGGPLADEPVLDAAGRAAHPGGLADLSLGSALYWEGVGQWEDGPHPLMRARGVGRHLTLRPGVPLAGWLKSVEVKSDTDLAAGIKTWVKNKTKLAKKLPRRQRERELRQVRKTEREMARRLEQYVEWNKRQTALPAGATRWVHAAPGSGNTNAGELRHCGGVCRECEDVPETRSRGTGQVPAGPDRRCLMVAVQRRARGGNAGANATALGRGLVGRIVRRRDYSSLEDFKVTDFDPRTWEHKIRSVGEGTSRWVRLWKEPFHVKGRSAKAKQWI